MQFFRSRSAVSVAAAAALAMTASPAMARHYHRDRGIDGGDVLAGVLIIGGIAAIASAASKDRRDRETRYPDRYPREGDYRSYPNDDPDYRNDRDYRSQRDEPYYRNPSGGYDYDDRQEQYGSRDWRDAGSMDGAVSSCVGEIERGRDDVDTVESVEREDEGWRVAGRVESGREFTCTVDGDGRIRRVAVDGRALI